MADKLSRGVLAKGQDVDGPITLQITELIKAENGRYKAKLTDGESVVDGVLSSQLAARATEGELKALAVVTLKDYQPNMVNGVIKFVMVELDIEEHLDASLAPAAGSASAPMQQAPAPAPAGPVKREAPEEAGAAGSTTPGASKVAKTESATSFRTPNDTKKTAGGASGSSGAAAATTPGPTPPTDFKAPLAAGTRKAMPISALNPYNNQFTIKAKVLHKGNKRTINGRDGKQKSLQTVELVDEQGTVIEATLWGELADKYGETLEQDKVYYFTRGQVKPANKQYSTVKNDYTINFGESTEVEECLQQDIDVKVKLEYVPFDRLSMHIGKKAPVDILGVVTSVGQLGEIARKSDGTMLQRRDLTLVDQSAKSVTITVWGELAANKASELEGMEAPIVSLSSCRVGDYNGMSLSSLSRSCLEVNPQGNDRADTLHSWYDAEGRFATFIPANEGLANATRRDGSGASGSNEPKPLGDFVRRGSDLPPADAKPEYINTSFTIVDVNTDQSMYYNACPENNRKVTEAPGGWLCEYDGKVYPNMVRRYVLRAKVMDFTGDSHVSVFNQEGEQLLGMSADALADLKASTENNGEEAFQNVVKAAKGTTWQARVMVKSREYNGNLDQRIAVQSMAPLDFVAQAKQLLGGIRKMATAA